MTCTDDVGGRVTDGVGSKGTFFYVIEGGSLAGSSVAVEWSDHARTVALQPLPGWCSCVYKPAGWFWPLRMAKRVSVSRERREEAKDVAKGRARRHRDIAQTSHSRTAPGKIRAMSLDKTGLFSWRLRAWRFVGSVTQRSAPRRWSAGGAHRPSGRGTCRGTGFDDDDELNINPPTPCQQ